MYLKKIELQGFKSFADRISISLDKGVTSIVGPNGSGKSNIADAVRWVLGEQSVKSLRGARMDDVIFSGTEHRKPSGFAEVTLLLDNSDNGLQVPYSEVSVTRRIYRSGESEFLINRSQCRLKDITELFFDTGVGREGYSIIGQGKVDEILNNKPEERRGIFEEAAGISKYKARRREAERKLDATSQNLVRIRDIISELGAQIELLAGQAAVARQYLQLRDELKEIEVAGYVSSIGKYEAALEKCEAGLSAAKDEHGRLMDELTYAEAEAGRIRERISLIDESQTGLNRAILDVEARLSNTKNNINLCIEKSEHAKADIERINAEISRVGIRKTGYRAELEAGKKKLGYLSGELARYEGLLVEIKAEYELVLSALGESDRAIEGLKQSVEEARDNFYNDRNKLSGMYAEREHYSKAVAAIEKNIAAAIRDIDDGNIAKDESIDKRLEFSAGTDVLHKALKAMSERRAGLGAAFDEKRREADEIAMELNAKQARLKILSDMENSFEGFYASVRRVLAECRRSREFGAGICGAVASLIDTPKGLETAISMALGAAQQNIVTEDEAAAERAIAFLKQTSGGRVTFLPITTIRGRTLDSSVRERLGRLTGQTGPDWPAGQSGSFGQAVPLGQTGPAGPLELAGPFGPAGLIGIAADLVGFDEKYRKIINELLGTTVVVDKLDNGLAIASRFKRAFRIVTLDGDIIATSGAITGGSVEARDSGILGRHREIQELTSAITLLKKRIAEKERERTKLEKELTALTLDITQKEQIYNERRVEYATLEQKISHIEEKIKADIGRRELYNLEIEEAKRGAANLNQVIGELEKALETQSVNIDKVQSEIDEYTEKNREGQQNRDELLSDISAYNVSVASVSEAQKAAAESIARLEGEMADSDRSIASREASIIRFNRDIEKYSVDIVALEAESQKTEQEKQGILLRIESVSTEKSTLNDESRGLADEAVRLNGLISGIGREIGRYETRAAKINAELDHCRNRLWEDYELTYHNALAMLTGVINVEAEVEAEAEAEVEAGVEAGDEINIGEGNDADIESKTDAETYSETDSNIDSEIDLEANDANDANNANNANDDDNDDDVDQAKPAIALNPPLMGEKAAKRSAKIRDEMRALGPVNVLAIEEYAQTKARYDKMEEQSRDLEEASGKLRQIISEMSGIMRKNFEEQFALINDNFDVVFRELFSGGRARLILSDDKDILEAGIEIEIQLPGKRMQNMMLYSGGERALTAIALIFAMLTLKQPPFCLLDEIESALDEANIERFSNYIRKYSDEVQFILVTHRKGTMEGSNILYGVTMQERGVSDVVSLRLSDAS